MKKTWLSIVLGVAVLLLGAVPYASAGTVCPDLTGSGWTNPGGTTNCDVLFTINADLSVTVTTPSLIPYDGIEDQLVGVVNNSNQAITSLTISGPNGLFGFDGDGVCSVPVTGCGTGDTTKYAPQGYSFTSINATQSTGTVNFPSIAAGGTGFFSLELAPSATAGIGGSVGGGTPTPEPVSFLLLAVGLIGLETMRRKNLLNV